MCIRDRAWVVLIAGYSEQGRKSRTTYGQNESRKKWGRPEEIGRAGRPGDHSRATSQRPDVAIPIRALSNVTFNERKGLLEMGDKKQARSFFNVGMAKKFMQTMLVADALSELQRAELTTSLREIYYRTKHTIQDLSLIHISEPTR